MAFPLYFVYMQEITAGQEIHRNTVEINVNNILKQRVFSEVDKLGNKFYQRNPRRERNLGDWEVKNDRGTVKRKLEISKGEEKQHLTINFEQKQMIGFDFMLSDGKTIVNLQKSKDGKLTVTRIDITGKPIPGSEDLSAREYLELSNFPVKLWIDRNVNAIVDTVDPSKVIRYVAPVALTFGIGAMAGKMDFNKPNSATSFKDAFLGPLPISQSVGNTENSVEKNIQQPKVSETPQDAIHFQNEYTQIFKTEKEAVLNGGEEGNVPKINILGSMQELELVTNFYLPSNAKKDGQSLELDIRKYLKSLNTNGIFNYRQYDSVGKPGKALVGDLEKALIDIRNNPYSQKSVYGLLDALHRFNTGKAMVTPESIMNQSGFFGSADNFSGQELWDAYWKNPDVFDAGTIKATSIIFDTTSVGGI